MIKTRLTKKRNAMKRMMIVSLLTMSMIVSSSTVSAQGRGRGKREDAKVEYRNAREKMDRNRQSNRNNRVNHGVDRRKHPLVHAPKPKVRRGHEPVPRGVKMVKCVPPKVNRGCYVPGWEGRVRYCNDGRWAYYVDGCWRYYDCYYNPYEFFAVPRPSHHAPVVACHGHGSDGEVVAGVVAGTILGCILSAVAD
jgi:hypothetical protein